MPRLSGQPAPVLAPWGRLPYNGRHMDTPSSLRQRLKSYAQWAAKGLFFVTHNGLATVGLGVAVVVLTLWLKHDWWVAVEDATFEWLQERRLAIDWLPGSPADRATAKDPKSLPASQAQLTQWIAQKYKLAPEPVAALVSEAHRLSKLTGLAPTLILAVVSIESGFQPFAQSHAGAQGLMQVMTGIHADRYARHGGALAAFDPVTNLRVGTQLLRDYIKLRDGSVEDGLLQYLGGSGLTEDSGYVSKVMAEKARMDQVASGIKVPFQ